MSEGKLTIYDQEAAVQAWEHRNSRDTREMRARCLKNLAAIIRQETTPRQWEMLQAYYMEGKRMHEIAAEYGISVSTVCRTLQRGQRRLKRLLKYSSLQLLK